MADEIDGHPARRFRPQPARRAPPPPTWPRRIGRGLAKAAVAATVDGAEVDLATPLPDGATVAIVTADTDEGRYVLRHSTAHVMAQAVCDLFPGAKYAIGPPIEDGFYYDFDLPGGARFSEDDLGRIEARMREIVGEDQPFVREELSREEGLARFADQPFKVEIIEGVDPDEGAEGGAVSVYRNDGWADLCRGPHVPSTTRLGSFKLMKVAGAYWRGDEHRPMLQRIYGTAWESDKALAEHLHRLEEAERRDHRKLGARARPVPLPARDRRRPARLPPQGRPHPQAHGGLLPGRARGRRLRLRLHAPPGQVDPVRDLGPPRLVRRRHVPAHGDGGRHLLPEAHELPDAHPHLQVAGPVLPGAAAAAVRVRDGVPLRALGRAPRPDPGAGLHPGRLPHLLSPPTSWPAS